MRRYAVIVSKKSVLLLKTSTVLHDYDTLEESLDSFSQITVL
jgi:hypothetical protein